ncbi:MAG: DEAD/DEAH box helicase family protein [Anaerolineae bacterium]|nr:DEAD/DEAH box helicase family protein [Anaerolineae bacterium]
MRDELVVLDLETTGLDVNLDSIIEIGAVRTRDGIILDEYSQLVDPGFPIPSMITHLTGIQTEDLAGKPGINAVLPALKKFIGSDPIVGHNVTFDTSFLQRHGLAKDNLRIDTYDLASVLIPRAPRYNLNSLTSQMEIDIGQAHRALDDARATALLYWQLWKKALALPFDTLYEITEAARGLSWFAEPVFEAALRERQAESQELPDELPDVMGLFEPYTSEERPLRPNYPLETIDLDKIASILDENGALAQTIPNYEHRPQQIEMARSVAEAFNTGDHVMIEAGTGTGKSLAYLVPAVLWAVTNNERVVISTNTINLQDQLILKDIPTLQKALKIPFRATLLKGRSNYLCPRRLAAIQRRRPSSVDELRTLAKILVWMLESSSGDRGEITLRGPVENSTWQRLSAEDEGCLLERCHTAMNGACPFFKARKNAETAHLLIVNHALLLSDATRENRVLPDYRYLVLDEAHHLEDAVTNSFSFRLDEMTFKRRLAELGNAQRGLLGEILRSVGQSASEAETSKLADYVNIISEVVTLMNHHISEFYRSLTQFVNDVDSGRSSDYINQIRIVPEMRERHAFATVQQSWQALEEFMEGISKAMERLTAALLHFEDYDIPGFNDLVSSTATAARFLVETQQQLSAFLMDPDPNTIYWLSLSQDTSYAPTIQTAPLHIGPLVESHLWESKESIIMTSATLRTNGSFNYLRGRLNADHVTEVEVGSPFNYQDSTLVYIPTDMPEPNNRAQYQQFVERGLIELAAALNGRVLGLFTSYSHLRQTSQAITHRLALGDITVYDQSDGTSRQALLEGFMSTEKAVLLGTRSFWEGVDIPGESLSALVIVRLPFAVPSDPIFAARSETYDNSFNEYAIPDAILRFRQGFGRLIRTATDRGIVTIFDRRIVSKRYGMNFLESLPDCTIQYGALKMLPAAAKDWLNHT